MSSIYDRALTVYETAPGAPPTAENLETLRAHFYSEKSISSRRFYESVEAGYQMDMLVEIPGWYDYKGTEYIRPADGQLYTLDRSERRTDNNGLHCMWLSLGLYSRAWADRLTLITEGGDIKLNGYLNSNAETPGREVVCSIVRGLDNSEAYNGDKDVLRRSLTVEVYNSDYRRERYADFRGQRYEIQSAVQTERFTVQLSMLEVIR